MKNNGTDLTAWMRSLVCAFVVRMQQKSEYDQEMPQLHTAVRLSSVEAHTFKNCWPDVSNEEGKYQESL